MSAKSKYFIIPLLHTNSTAVLLVLHQCRADSALKYTVSSLFDPINKVESALSVRVVVVRYIHTRHCMHYRKKVMIMQYHYCSKWVMNNAI